MLKDDLEQRLVEKKVDKADIDTIFGALYALATMVPLNENPNDVVNAVLIQAKADLT